MLTVCFFVVFRQRKGYRRHFVPTHAHRPLFAFLIGAVPPAIRLLVDGCHPPRPDGSSARGLLPGQHKSHPRTTQGRPTIRRKIAYISGITPIVLISIQHLSFLQMLLTIFVLKMQFSMKHRKQPVNVIANDAEIECMTGIGVNEYNAHIVGDDRGADGLAISLFGNE